MSLPTQSSRSDPLEDYDLSRPLNSKVGLRQGLAAYGDAHFSLFLRKAFIKAAGYGEDALTRPLIEAVKRGVQLNGGLPIEFPTISLHESFSSPTSMYLRNLMSMDTEEMIKAQPLDACIMIGGCDKTVPAQLMGGISANKPVLPLVTGPMMPGSHRGTRIGACTDCRNNWAAYRAGVMDIEDIAAINDELAPTSGTCGVMGTASTMACITAALGLMPLRGASAPAVSATRLRVAEETGKNAVVAVSDEHRPQTILTKESFLNAITVLQAIGGSTNAVVHIMAIVNRHPDVAGTITLDTFDEIGKKTPLVVDLKPSGDGYMTDFHNAGGMTALLQTIRPLLFLSARTVTGQSLGEVLDASSPHDFPYSHEIIRPLSNPLYPRSSIVVLRGNLAPGGADRRLLSHAGAAVVFSDTADLARRIDDPELEVTADSVLDMLRLSDGRMSGTAGGTIVLHISPESVMADSVYGVVQDGDIIRCDVENRLIQLDVPDEEIVRRIADTKSANSNKHAMGKKRGYRGLYERSVNQAEHGVDFDFLTAAGPS
ncbi:dihydroxy-acid/6-phosphogluconate dehydratase [Mycena olivaceomarginata]|nr:dihydroxy-acid/6-phosphogluconate dehydratase [Mycena olivaceomarginata]